MTIICQTLALAGFVEALWLERRVDIGSMYLSTSRNLVPVRGELVEPQSDSIESIPYIQALRQAQGERWVFRSSHLLLRVGPGVARRQVTFLASPRKVTKRRRPEVRRPANARGSLCYSKRQAAAELGLVDAPCKWAGAVLALGQSSRTTPVIPALLGDSHRDLVVSQPLQFIFVFPAQAGIQ